MGALETFFVILFFFGAAESVVDDGFDLAEALGIPETPQGNKEEERSEITDTATTLKKLFAYKMEWTKLWILQMFGSLTLQSQKTAESKRKDRTMKDQALRLKLESLEEEGCPNDARDIVFVIDGSSSMRTSEFMHLKQFVAHAMKSFPNNTQFSLLQYSSRIQDHFDFRHYRRNPDPDHLLSPVKQLGGSTHTASAITKAVRDLFVLNRGARNTASKILVVVTDGLKTGDPLGYPEAVEVAEKAGVVRFAIGVGLGFISTTAQRELHAMASHPATEHVLHVRHFTELQDTTRQLKEKICSRHGPSVPQPTIPPQLPHTCTSSSDPQVLQKLERVLSGLDAINAKLDSLAIRQGKCRRDANP